MKKLNFKKTDIQEIKNKVKDFFDSKPFSKEKIKKFFDPKSFTKKKIVLIATSILALFLIISLVVNVFLSWGKANQLRTAEVSRGDITSVVEGTGTISAINQYEITSFVKGEILEDYFAEGDMVEEGDLMYKIDTTDIDNSIEKSVASVEKAQLSYNQSMENVENLRVTSPISGVITSLNVSDGDNVSSGTKVAQIIDSENMLLKINFNSTDAKNIYSGQSAKVNLETSFITVDGKVTNVGTGSFVNEDGVLVTTVEILVSNPGSIVPGDRATALVGNYACNSEGTFEYQNSKTLIAKVSGEVYNLNYKTGDYIKKGSALFNIDSTSTIINAKQSQLSLKDAQLSLQSQYDSMEDYNITAPISGKVIQKNIKAGENLDNTNNTTVMAIIADLSTLVFEMSIDELDITSVSVGQDVQITVDAIPGQKFTGYVDNISIVGTSSNGVTSYPVKVVINNTESTKLVPGMNVSASIVIDSRTDVIRVPVSAIRRGNIVYIKGNSSKSNHQNADAPKININDIPDGFTAVTVKTGLADENFIEIISGLAQGDIVALPDITVSDTSIMGMMNNMHAGGIPTGGGGMPAGGRGMQNRAGTQPSR